LIVTPLLMVILCLTMVATSFLSGLFGMAGGMILVGVLLAIMPVPAAMALHAVTQMASNGWRALLWRRNIRWIAVGAYALGCVLALLMWSAVRYVPSKPASLILLGVTPFIVGLAPDNLRPNPESLVQGIFYGSACMTLMLLTGVSGPLLDSYFLGSRLGRREIVATKAACQVMSHGVKLVYFGGIIDEAASLDPVLVVCAVLASVTGTTLAKRYLEAMSETMYRTWARRLIAMIAGYYVICGTSLLLIVQT
jgi:uncharacterized membrane protein YfcA